MTSELGLPAGTPWKNDQGSRHAEHNFRAGILLHEGQCEIDACRYPARRIDISITNEGQTGVHLDRRIRLRQKVGVHPVGRRAPMMQQTGGRQDEGARANGCDPPRLRRYATNPFDKRWIPACVFAAHSTHHDQRIQAVVYFSVFMGCDDLHPGHGPDGSWSGSQKEGLIVRFFRSPQQPKHKVREIKRFERAGYIEDFAIRVY